jgi:hypothetical protein
MHWQQSLNMWQQPLNHYQALATTNEQPLSMGRQQLNNH